jgi:hypothetical protein
MSDINQIFPRDNREHLLWHDNPKEEMLSPSHSSIDDLIKELQRLKKCYKKKKLFWEIAQYQDEPHVSLIVYSISPETDIEYRQRMRERIVLIESNIEESNKRKKVMLDYLRKECQ